MKLLSQRRIARVALVPCVLAAVAAGTACSGTADSSALSSSEAASVRATSVVRLRASVGGEYLAVAADGSLNAKAESAADATVFTLADTTHSTLQSGDYVELTGPSGLYVSADNGGGGSLFDNRSAAKSWELFRIGTSGGGTISNGDAITLRTSVSRQFVSAVSGGGGAVYANQSAASTWETFELEVVTGSADAGASTDGGSSGSSQTVDGGATTSTSTSTSTLYQQLTTLTANCSVASNGKYATDEGNAATIDICKLSGAYFWKSDMDVDCDGQTTSQCSSSTDPAYYNETSFTQSNGQFLNAATLPYVVVPLPSSRFNYESAGIEPGALAIVLYKGQVAYGVFGDEGPSDAIGEASYAMAKSLGIDPDPATGGIESGVTFIVLTGSASVVAPIESHDAAVALGATLAKKLLAGN